MTIKEATKLWGVSDTTIKRRIDLGMIPYTIGCGRGGRHYIIPDELSSFEPFRKLPPQEKRAECKQSKADDPADYICKNACTRSIRSIASDLGIATADVRRIFDTLLAEGRIYGQNIV